MATTEKHGLFPPPQPKTREEVRKSLRLVTGGKPATPVVNGWLDDRSLQEDRFLRDHYLDRGYLFGIIPDGTSLYGEDDE